MLYLSLSNTVKTSALSFEAADSAGVSGVMPATPEITLVTFTGVPPRDRLVSRYTLGMPSGVPRKYSEPSGPNSGFELRPLAKPAISRTAPAVCGDPHALLQIFLNLCQNSLRAVADVTDPRLRITMEKVAEDAVVTISDSGPGVADESILFHPFRPEADGSGLGLFISRELARSFG